MTRRKSKTLQDDFVCPALQATNRAWRWRGILRFVTLELKPNIVELLMNITNVEQRSVEPVTKVK